LDEHKLASKASGATPAGALTRPHGGNFTHSRTSCRGGTHPYTFGRPLREGEGDVIALCKQRLQRAAGLKPSNSTNALPLAWQFSLSCGGVSDEEEHQAPGWRDGQAARDCEEQPPDHTGPAGCPPRKLSSSISSTEDPAGGQAGGQHPPHHLPGRDIVARRDDAKNGHQTWHQRHGQASQSPFRLRDIAEAGPHEPDALLLIPLKLRDGAHALSGFPPPLASILLRSKPKKARPPRLGAGRERQRKTLRGLGDARSKSREVGEERESHDPHL